MKIFRRPICVIMILMIIFFSCACTDNVQETASITEITTETRDAHFESTHDTSLATDMLPTSFYIDENIAEHIFNIVDDRFQGAIIIGDSGQRIFEASFGYSDFESREFLSDENAYEIGLLTGQLTLKAFFLLIEEEGIELDVPISEYIPEYRFADEISIQNLIDMSSGIPDYLDDTFSDEEFVRLMLRNGITQQESLEEINEYASFDASFIYVLDRIGSDALLFEPGERVMYSATNIVFMAEIISRVSGTPYVHYVQRNILTPMHLDSASFTDTLQTASGHLYGEQLQIIMPGTRLISDAGLRMSASDLFLWSSHLISLLNTDYEGLSHGLSIMFEKLPSSIFIANSAIGGYYCIQVIIPDIEIVILILSNQNRLDHPAEDIMRDILNYYIEQYQLYEDN